MTKEDLRELIFREILEYHPLLLKDYMNGTERANFLYPRFLFIISFQNVLFAFFSTLSLLWLRDSLSLFFFLLQCH